MIFKKHKNHDFLDISPLSTGGECFAPPPSARGSAPSSKIIKNHDFSIFLLKYLEESASHPLPLQEGVPQGKIDDPRIDLGSLRYHLGIIGDTLERF